MIRMINGSRGPWTVLDDLVSMQDEFNRLFDQRGLGPYFGRQRFPPVNVWQSDDTVVVEAELPGIDPNEVNISVADGEVTLSGKRVSELGTADTVHQKERPEGEFARTVQLPFRVDAAQVQATYKLGVLRITLPRAEADKPKRIVVKAA
ncbi:MAG: Hsp20/alpha crystallin family protein [Candidatus Hydrogenedentes bacterium]|nr:Hsp20/alpha crystallin family protein [Candidatus Hydrogenedentota bacterium]